MIKKIEEILVIDNGFIKVFNDRVSFGDSVEGNYIKISNSSNFPNFGITVICLYKDKIYLQDSYRYAHQSYSLETVKGFGMNDHTPIETAEIEISEEIGGKIKSITSLGCIKNDISDTNIFCFAAEISSFSETNHEETEFIKNIKGYTLEEVKSMVKNNIIKDALTLAILTKFLCK